MAKPGLVERLKDGPLICAEGYVFELERRGYVQAGPFVPQVVLENPDAVTELHREFMLAGSDVVLALTYYAHRAKLEVINITESLEEVNRRALQIARGVADEFGALTAGNICNTNVYNPDEPDTLAPVRAMFEEQIGWAANEGVDYIVGETFPFFGEALIGLETIQQAGLPAVITLAVHRDGRLRDGMDPVEACRRLRDAGAEVVGLNCIRGPNTMLPLMKAIAAEVKPPLAALPVAYRTTEAQPTFQSLDDEAGIRPPHGCCFPTALDPFTCTRYDIAAFTDQAAALGYNYLGVCCGAAPHHIRAMAEALGRTPPASRFSPDMTRHFAFGADHTAKAHDRDFQNQL